MMKLLRLCLHLPAASLALAVYGTCFIQRQKSRVPAESPAGAGDAHHVSLCRTLLAAQHEPCSVWQGCTHLVLSHDGSPSRCSTGKSRFGNSKDHAKANGRSAE